MSAVLKLAQVEERVSLKKSTIYQMIARDEFPAPTKIGGASRWLDSTIDRWIASTFEESSK